MKRRDFVKAGFLGIAALHLPQRFSSFPASAAPQPELSIINGGDIASRVRTAVDALGGIARFVNSGDIVVLKPNMSFANPPEWGTTTHPDVIRAIVELCSEAGAGRIVVTDFPMRRAAACLERSGMTALAAEMPEMTFVELGEERQFETVKTPEAVEFKEIAVARILLRADVFINIPTAKTHGGTTVSFGIKNLMGLIHDRKAFHGQYDLSSAVADLATILRPQLTIMDATHALLDRGPQGPGTVEDLECILAGTDPLTLDVATLALAQWNGRVVKPGDVRHFALAAERGVGSMAIDEERTIRTHLS